MDKASDQIERSRLGAGSHLSSQMGSSLKSGSMAGVSYRTPSSLGLDPPQAASVRSG